MVYNSIGLYLSAKPLAGGEYQYTLSIIKALDSFDVESFSITTFYYDHEWEKILPEKFNKKYYKKNIIRRVLSKIYRSLDKSLQGEIRFAKFFNPMIEIINNSDCEIVIFPNQDVQSFQVKKKSLVSIHDLMHRYEPHYDEYKGTVYKARENKYKNICKYSKGVLVDSAIGKEHVIESYNKNPDEVFELPFVPPFYLLEAKEVDIKSRFNLRDDFFFYPAQFWEHKNHTNLIKAVKILKEKKVQVHLVLVGAKKNYYQNILKLITRLDIHDHVSILGYVSNDEIYTLYKKAVALLFVSLIGPTNIPPLEGMLLGCPVIVSNKYAMPEQVGDAGLLVDPEDPADIASKMELILKNKDLRKSMIERGTKIISSWQQNDFNRRLLSIIKSITD